MRFPSIMTQDVSDTGSIAAKFVDVDGIRRGIYERRVAAFRPIKSDKAALGKSRRLMSSCINAADSSYISSISCHVPEDGFIQVSHLHFATTDQSSTHILTFTSMLAERRPSRSCQKWIGCPTLDKFPTQKRKKEFTRISAQSQLRRNLDF